MPLNPSDLRHAEFLLKRLNYNFQSLTREIQNKDPLVAINDKLINENKLFYDELAKNVSDHIKILNEKGKNIN